MATAVANPLTITTWALNAAAVHSGPFTATADPLAVRVWVHSHIHALVTPASTLATHAVRSEWGGIVICRPAPDLAADLQTLTDFGFRVLGQEARAGEVHVAVFGTEVLAREWVSDIIENKRLRAHFVPYPYGERITAAGVFQNWNEGRRLIV